MSIGMKMTPMTTGITKSPIPTIDELPMRAAMIGWSVVLGAALIYETLALRYNWPLLTTGWNHARRHPRWRIRIGALAGWCALEAHLWGVTPPQYDPFTVAGRVAGARVKRQAA